MTPPGASVSLVGHVALLALISFGGVPGVLPDLREFVVVTQAWLSDREFADCFAVVQAIPGPNMILMMGFLGWKIAGMPTAMAASLVTFVPPCALAYATFGFWERFRETAWQQRVRRGLAPVTIGLVIAGGYVMAGTGGGAWPGLAATAVAAALMLATRISPLWLLAAGAALGGVGLL